MTTKFSSASPGMNRKKKPRLGKLAKNIVKRLAPGRSRKKADHLASKILAGTCSFITDAQILSVLKHWCFHKNHTRPY